MNLLIGNMNLLIISGGAAFLVFAFFVAIIFRRVVPTNEVHIVQSGNTRISYGGKSDNEAGNAYYEWPTSIPKFGVTKSVLPLAVFNVDLIGYEAYDVGRLPFVVDVTAFFRISDPKIAAERVSTFEELEDQLQKIVQGAVRSILATNGIEEIMQGRSKFGDQFTEEVKHSVANFGVETVKNIELMDIRDSNESNVIRNIMDKKKSEIERESRVVVAENMRKATIAEVDAERDIEVQKQNAAKEIGQRTAEKDQAVGIADEQAKQAVKQQELITTERIVAVNKAAEVGKAEIDRGVEVVKAEQVKQTTVLKAEGDLRASELQATGIKLTGEANAAAEMAMLMAPVEAQIKLAADIAAKPEYMKFLISSKGVEALKDIGTAQAGALTEADIKLMVSSGDIKGGLDNVMDLFSAKGGHGLAGLLESLTQSGAGTALLERLGLNVNETVLVNDASVESTGKVSNKNNGSKPAETPAG